MFFHRSKYPITRAINGFSGIMVEIGTDTLIAVAGGLTGAYGAIQSWLTSRKTRQISIELLMTKFANPR